MQKEVIHCHEAESHGRPQQHAHCDHVVVLGPRQVDVRPGLGRLKGVGHRHHDDVLYDEERVVHEDLTLRPVVVVDGEVGQHAVERVHDDLVVTHLPHSAVHVGEEDEDDERVRQ